MKTSGIFTFWPKLSPTCTESVVRGEVKVQVGESLGQKVKIPEVFITKKGYENLSVQVGESLGQKVKIPEVFITKKAKKHESRKSPIPYYIVI